MPAVPFFAARDVEAAVPPERAYEAVRDAFVAHARGEWTMQPKLYVTNYPAGDFRAMPALGVGVAASLEEALAADVVVTVTPGKEILLGDGSLQPGQHVSLMGADGPGKAEIAVAEIVRTRIFCDEWEQASHGGELAAAVEAGAISRADVTELGRVLTGEAPGRRSDDEITIFDSTGLAIQDLAVATAAMDNAGELDLPTFEL